MFLISKNWILVPLNISSGQHFWRWEKDTSVIYFFMSELNNIFQKLSPRLATLKETLAQVFSCKCCEISKKTFFYRTPLVAASHPPLKSPLDYYFKIIIQLSIRIFLSLTFDKIDVMLCFTFWCYFVGCIIKVNWKEQAL